MGKASKATTPTTMDFEIAEDRSCELDDFTVNFVTIRQDHDLAPMLASLPGGMCQCPHWGVMTKGRMTVRYADREEVFEAGDAFYMPPGPHPGRRGRHRVHPVQPDRPARRDRGGHRQGDEHHRAVDFPIRRVPNLGRRTPLNVVSSVDGYRAPSPTKRERFDRKRRPLTAQMTIERRP